MEGLVLVLFVSCGLVDGDPGEPVVMGAPQRLRAVVGADVVLPCHLEPPIDATDILLEWRLWPDIVHFYRNRTGDPDLQSERFRGRTSLFHLEMTRGNLSLKLTNVTEDDAGTFFCFVPEWGKGQVELEVGNNVRFAIIVAIFVMVGVIVFISALMGFENLRLERRVWTTRRSRIRLERAHASLSTSSPEPSAADSVSADEPLQIPHPV